MKTCTKCGLTKLATEFVKQKGRRDGLTSACKSCRKCINAKWAAANPEKVAASRSKWLAENYEKHKAAVSKWQAENPENRRQRVAKWRSANPEKDKAATAKWQAANPEALRINNNNRRARKREVGGSLSKGLAAKLFKLQRGKCACGCGLPLGDNYHLDHTMPLALGGRNEDSNIQLLRARCNYQKHAKHPIDFMQQRGFLL